MSGHASCCRNRKVPKTRAQFAALNYPPNAHGHDDVKNRLHNPEKVKVKYLEPHHKRMRKGWWFRLDPASAPPLLDGSGDNLSRGTIKYCKGIKPVHADDRLICLNAANLKVMPVPGEPKPRQCGFAWLVGTSHPSQTASGWMPLKAIKFNHAKSRVKMMGALQSWACCLKKYEKWGRSLTRSTSTEYKFRSLAELEAELKDVATSAAKFKSYFREIRTGGVKKILKKCAGSREKLSSSIGILPACKNGNKLTDYLPKGEDQKSPGGYTNLSANVSIGESRPGMAPIALDIFPAGHTFHRVRFKDNKPVLGFIYKVKKKNPGERIGRAVWYYGYCDVVGGDKKQRRYGWVPALALKRA